MDKYCNSNNKKYLDSQSIKYLKHSVYKVIKDIKDELELIEMLLYINEYIIENKYEYIKEALKRIKYANYNSNINDINNKFKFSSKTCLLGQIFSSEIKNNMTEKYITNEIITIFKDYINFYGNKCQRYYDNETYNITCEHDTFKFYTLNKWFNAYNNIIKVKYNLDTEHCSDTTEFTNSDYIKLRENSPSSISNKTNINSNFLFYPRDIYCNRCYDFYKEYINKIDQQNIKPSEFNKLDYYSKYIYFKYKDKIRFYRLKYSSACDGTWNEKFKKGYIGHKKEYITIKNNKNNILKSFLESLKNEIRDYHIAYNKFLTK